MKSLLAITALLIASLANAAPLAMDCNLGPANKTFGGAPWLVYGCADQHSLAIVSAPGSPALPYYFFFAWKDGSYHLSGEGTGDKATTDAAFAELGRLGKTAIAGLYQEASAAAR
jgi:hypothetical protein